MGIRPDVLGRLRFPVGEYSQGGNRDIAGALGLHHVAEKPDSQEICFVPDRTTRGLSANTDEPQDTSGAIVTTDGREVGRHGGVEQFTIGQRKGLGVAFGEPRYVVRIDAQTREVVRGDEGRARTARADGRGANWFVRPEGRAGVRD